ncbi:MAG: sialidase family protein [Micromonosporaceae bacterium]
MRARREWSGFLALAAAVLSVGGFATDAPADAQPEDRSPAVTAAPEVPATANLLQKPQSSNSPMLAVDPTEARFVVLANRIDAPDFGCALQISGDGGGSWIPAGPVPKLPVGAEKCYAPEVAFGPDGTLYYLFVGLAGAGNTPMGAFLTTSSDRARSFSPPRQVLGPNNFAVRMAVDRTSGSGRLHLVWLKANSPPGLGSLPTPPNPIVSAHSDDGGRTFSEPVQVSDPDRQLVAAPALALGPDHSVHVLYYDLGRDARDYHGLEGPTWEDEWSLVLATSGDGGRHFAEGRVVDDDVVPPQRVMLIFTMPPPALATDESGRILAAWHDARNGDWDVFLRRSDDGGATWAQPRRLNDDRVRNGRHQYQPRLSLHGRRVDAIFYDRRDDPGNVRNDVRFTFSTDAGTSFSPTIELTSTSSDTRVGQSYAGPAAAGLVEFGSRTGLVSLPDRAVAAWTDTRNAVVPRQQDVFSTVVRVPQATDGTPAPWVPIGAAAVVLLVVVGVVHGRRRRRSRRDGAPA